MSPLPPRTATLLAAAQSAGRALPPAFPLEATVAVNPFLGQTSHDLATAAERLARVAGAPLTRPRGDVRADLAAGRITASDIAAAQVACPHADAPDVPALMAMLERDAPAPQALPTVADLAAAATGTDWPALIARTFGLWAAGRFDRGQALWTPAPGPSAFAAWRDWATRDLTPEIAGLTGFCAHIAQAPDTADRAILRAADRLALPDAAAETAFHRLLSDLGGWAQHARWLLWQAELAGTTDTTLTDLLAIRLLWDEALLHHAPQVAPAWAATCAAHAAPVTPTPDRIADAIFQDAAERAHQRHLATLLTGPVVACDTRPALQAAFCIDVRSEVFRRALESLSPRIETTGFAGFFGLPVAHRAAGSTCADSHLPVLLNPALTARADLAPEIEDTTRIAARAARAWGRFRQAAVSSFAFVEAAGPVYGAKLVRDALGLAPAPGPAAAPRFDPPLSADAKAAIAAKVLTAMGLTTGLAPVVLLLGHGAQVTNAPHESAYQCGACGGQSGEISARLLAGLLNDPETRAGLAAHAIALPSDTRFIAGLHDTTTDRITLHDAPDLPEIRDWMARAGALARAERSLRLPGDAPATRARNWAEPRPEWGLAGCAAFIAAPRAATRGRDLSGRAFLHGYDWRTDPGFATLDLILTAPVVVASWISLQYHASTLAPDIFGGGNKLIHNVTGGIGVVEGNGGTLRTGLPWQAVHDGVKLAHTPLRLTVMIEAPPQAIADILARHPAVRALFENCWLHLIALDGGRPAARYRPGLAWDVV